MAAHVRNLEILHDLLGGDLGSKFLRRLTRSTLVVCTIACCCAARNTKATNHVTRYEGQWCSDSRAGLSGGEPDWQVKSLATAVVASVALPFVLPLCLCIGPLNKGPPPAKNPAAVWRAG